ncbi:MAG: hypothetical protein Q7J07_10900 [Pelolinea sp.]|nr:hypothetical protein [Pelolinea sp.]
MKNILLKFPRLLIGYFLYALGIVMTINAQQGLDPWGVFHQGLSFKMNITFGIAVNIVGAVIVILDFIFGERIGWGTIGNVIFIGTFIDLITSIRLVPVFDNTILSFLMMFIGMFTISLAAYFYLSAQLGAGPRDGLMIALTKRTNKPVGLVRGSLEVTALIIGYFLGGSVGWGTLIMSLVLGLFFQTTFKILHFDVKQVEHRYVDQDIAFLIQKLKPKNGTTNSKSD